MPRLTPKRRFWRACVEQYAYEGVRYGIIAVIVLAILHLFGWVVLI